MEQPFGKPPTPPPTPESSWYTQATTRYSPPAILITYLKRRHDDLQNDIDLDFFCQALVGAEIEQLKRTSGQNAVMADRSGQRTGREGGDEDGHVIRREFTLSESSADQMAAVGP